MAVTVAIGGGTLRDAILLGRAVFWLEEWAYFWMSVMTGALTFFAWRHLPTGARSLWLKADISPRARELLQEVRSDEEAASRASARTSSRNDEKDEIESSIFEASNTTFRVLTAGSKDDGSDAVQRERKSGTTVRRRVSSRVSHVSADEFDEAVGLMKTEEEVENDLAGTAKSKNSQKKGRSESRSERRRSVSFSRAEQTSSRSALSAIPFRFLHERDEARVKRGATFRRTVLELEHGNSTEGPLLFWLDALGLGAFAVIGVMNGVKTRCHPSLCLVTAVCTACGGGVVRDVLCGLPAERRTRGRIFHAMKGWYAFCSLAGALVYLVLLLTLYEGRGGSSWGMPLRSLAGVATTMAMRVLADGRKLGLPSWSNGLRFTLEDSG